MQQKLLIIIICLISALPSIHGSSPSTTGVITGDGVNLRSRADTSARIISVLNRGSAVVILQTAGSWYHVQLQDGIQGWIYNRYINANSNPTSTSRERFSSRLSELIAYAKTFLGTTYRYGGASAKGFDCSGFVLHIYSQCGISLPHQAILQMEHGEIVETLPELLPGDLVFFKTEDSTIVNHVGIYLGDSEFIHASSGRGSVTISPLDSGYYNTRFSGARRLINDSY